VLQPLCGNAFHKRTRRRLRTLLQGRLKLATDRVSCGEPFVKAASATVILIIVACTWYIVAANYSYAAMAGTYRFQGTNETSTLILKENQSFQQTRVRPGSVAHAQGSWRRIGRGGVVFSPDFLRLKSQCVTDDAEIYGQFRKKFGLFRSLELGPDPADPVFR
jgi:hypothetical protein